MSVFVRSLRYVDFQMNISRFLLFVLHCMCEYSVVFPLTLGQKDLSASYNPHTKEMFLKNLNIDSIPSDAFQNFSDVQVTWDLIITQSQRARDAIIMSSLRQHDVGECWRSEDVIFASLMRYVSVGIRLIQNTHKRHYIAHPWGMECSKLIFWHIACVRHFHAMCDINSRYSVLCIITWWWVLYSCRNSLLRQKSPCFDRKSPSGNSCCWTYPLYKIFRAKIAIKWSLYKLCI